MLLTITSGVILVVGIAYVLFPSPCSFEFNFFRLLENVSVHVYGQHIACVIIPREISRYFDRHQTYFEPLILSFHGSYGVGKNYMAKFIVDFFPRKTELIFTAETDAPHRVLTGDYASNVKRRIMSTVAECHVNIVILDEVEDFSNAVMEEILKSLDYFSSKKNFPIIVLLLGNSRSLDINNVVFTTKLPRRRLTRTDFEFSRTDNEWYAKDIWQKRRIVFVPFLPLEEQHVIDCIKHDLHVKREKQTRNTIQQVINELIFTEQENGRHYSVYGCKSVSDKVDYVRQHQ